MHKQFEESFERIHRLEVSPVAHLCVIADGLLSDVSALCSWQKLSSDIFTVLITHARSLLPSLV